MPKPIGLDSILVDVINGYMEPRVSAVVPRMRMLGVVLLLPFFIVGCRQTIERPVTASRNATEIDEIIAPLPKAAAEDVVHGPRTRFPLFGDIPSDASALERLARDPEAVQPWLRGPRTPPLTMDDLGLKGRLSLAEFGGTKREWGVHVVVEDAHGNVFAFCSEQRWKRAGDAYIDRYFLGGTSPDKRFVRVEEGTPSYKFLQALVWHFANDPRYRATPARLKEVQTMLHVSDGQFEKLLEPPAWP